MNLKQLLVFTVIVAVLFSSAKARAITTASAQRVAAVHGHFQSVAFRDSAEAGMLRRAYHILATGDHDYKGHRVGAMHAVEAAGNLLGMDLKGDDKDREPQPLSDAKLREARGLLQNVLGAAGVKAQKRVVRHINKAIKQINVALSIH